MAKKIIVLVVLLIAVGSFVAIKSSSKDTSDKKAEESLTQDIVPTQNNTTVDNSPTSPSQESTQTQKPTPNPAPKTGEYTMTDVSKHANSTSCWSAINGIIYDLTKWIGSHPGGEMAILSICGKDGSAAFNDQHGGQQKQENVLASFKIGILVK